MNLNDICNEAVAIAREAGALLRDSVDQQTTITTKSSAVDLVTAVDLASEKLISDRLRAAFPDHHLIGEEGGQYAGAENNVAEKLTWYIDPIDGTNNFAHGFPIFCVSLALCQGNESLVGVVYDPMRDECFQAAKGNGAYLVNPKGSRRLQVSQAKRIEASLLATGFPYDRHTNSEDNIAQTAAFLKRAQGLRRPGSAALDMAYVAAGRLDGYWEFKLKPWDIAAGRLLVEEAGGAVSTIVGNPLILEPLLSLVASNGKIHTTMLSILAQALEPSSQS